MARRKNDFVISEEFKKELLAKLFKNGYGKTPEHLFEEKYCGYSDLVPLEVKFYSNMMDIDRMGRIKGGARAKEVMDDIVSDIFGRRVKCGDDEHPEDFNQDLQAKVIYFNNGVTLLFKRKEKENAA